MIIVMMGVSGSGKTTIGTILAGRMGVAFADADDFHSAANKAKMAAGHALDDTDRQPWLETLNGVMRGWYGAGKGGVLACSALKESYRETLAAGMPEGTVQFVLLEVAKEEIAERMATRHHEFMNPALLDSQLATLEAPGEGLHIENDLPPEDVVQRILTHVHLRDGEDFNGASLI